ncbi:MAG: Formate--tetrahydrofolate ligase [Candidatus Heimdallarchaeota archaeon LC_2]|nr:MAG: Formate--tetrahydrofolate ligase [Candidatus Heimdallarchaeota archaeon LC_2]
MKSSLEIAQEAKLKPIEEVAASVGLTSEDIELHGKSIAKIALSKSRLNEISKSPKGKYVLVTAISPTPAGEGKTTTAIGLTQGLVKIGKKAIVTLRQPSLGPVFGIKGGAAGAGYSQVLPMEEINLGFTGDFSKIESAHNLLAAMMDNHIFRKNKLNFDLTTIQYRRAMDMNDRALRDIVLALGDPMINGVARLSGFDITAASEIMAILALAKDLPDLKDRMSKIVLGRNMDGKIITAADINAQGAMTAIMKHAIKPNLVQTIEGVPCFMHSGPFGNIAHGCSSIIGDDIALHMADYVITEAGFGSDLGAEKFFDIKCRQSGHFPDLAVVVTTIKALKIHGGLPYDKELLKKEDLQAVKEGCRNLGKHVGNMEAFGVPVVVALNKFPTDTDAEIALIKKHVDITGNAFSVCEGVAKGGEGAVDLATVVDNIIASRDPPTPQFIYELNEPIEEKITKIAKTIYGAGGVVFSKTAQMKINQYKEDGYGDLPICMAKTHLSLTDDPTVKGAPQDFDITINDVRISAGAGFIYPITGKVLTMPGLPPIPAAVNIDIDDEGKITGLF